MTIRATLDPSTLFARHPLRPHELRERITRTEDVIVLCHLGVPRLGASDWSLSIDGLVRRPLRLALDDLKQRRRVEITSVHQCAGNPMHPDVPTRRVCNVVWGGVRLSDLLADCEVEPYARFVWASGADYGKFQEFDCEAYVKDVPLDSVAADVLIAYEMNGAPLQAENGYPARLVVPGFYATNSVKWLRRVTLADSRAAGPFTTRWYNDIVRDAAGQPTGATSPVWRIAPDSVIVSPAPDQAVAAGEAVEVWGWTWADGGVESVDLSADGGHSWMRATVEPLAGHAWQRFRATWNPVRGQNALCARAQSIGRRRQPFEGARNELHRVPVKVG